MAEYYCDSCALYSICDYNPTGEVLRCANCGKVLIRVVGLKERDTLEVKLSKAEL